MTTKKGADSDQKWYMTIVIQAMTVLLLETMKSVIGMATKKCILTNEDVHVNVRACDSSNRLRCGCGCATHRIVA